MDTLGGPALVPGGIVCASAALTEAGRGVRFLVVAHGSVRPAFAIRYRGRAYAYLNACAHKAVELDWQEGDFFDADGQRLICATHGALYDPATGACIAGPCRGRALTAVAVQERDNVIILDQAIP